MARRKRVVKTLPTIWEVNDELWKIIQQIIDQLDPEPTMGRSRIDPRPALNGIIYPMRSGCQWNQLPRKFGDDSSIHRLLQRWVNKGVFHRIWETLIDTCQELDGVEWEWQSADAAQAKARFGGTTSAHPPQPPRIAGKMAPNAA